MNNFSIRESIRSGWGTFKRRPWFFVGVMLVLCLVQIGIQVVSLIPILGFFISIAAGTFIGIGLIRLALGAIANVETSSMNDLWYPSIFWRYLLAYILMTLVIVIPMAAVGFLAIAFGEDLFFIAMIPAIIYGAYMGLRLGFAMYFVVDKNMKPLESIKASWAITSGTVLRLIGFCLVLGLLNLLGAIALLVGLFVTIPISLLAYAVVYRALEKKYVSAEVEAVV